MKKRNISIILSIPILIFSPVWVNLLQLNDTGFRLIAFLLAVFSPIIALYLIGFEEKESLRG